ncbi:MAG TPA: hypothetical protein VF590_15390, partial [Isosphaeraceae bacterium]
MPPLTEETIHRIAPDDKAVKAARDLVRQQSFRDPGVSADDTWLLAECQGGATYQVSIDLTDPTAPV